MPVNASSFGQADRKEEKVSGYKSNKRGGGESSKWNWKTKIWGKRGMKKKGRVVSVLLQKAEFNVKFHRRATHSLNVFWNSSWVFPLEGVCILTIVMKRCRIEQKETLVVSWQCTTTNITKAPFTLIILCVSYQIRFKTYSFTITHTFCASISPPKNFSALTLTRQKTNAQRIGSHCLTF